MATSSADEAPPPPSESAATTEPVDLTSSPQSLHRAVHARRAEYTRPHRLKLKVGTWNVAACPGTDKDLATWFVSGKGLDKRLANLDGSHNSALDDGIETVTVAGSGDSSGDDGPGSIRLIGNDDIGLYVLGLQEIVDLNPVTQYVYSDSNPTAKWRAALEAALPKGYELVTSEQLSGLLLLVYASPEIAPSIGNVSTKAVGTGVGGWFGNKGAVVTRIVLGETTRLVFVNCHLSSGNDSSALERRCWDVGAIVDRTQFDPVAHAGVVEDDPERIGDEDFGFWFGDLNFRLDDIPGDDIRRILMLHTRGEYDLKKKPTGHAGDGEDVIVMRAYDSSGDDDSVSLPDPDDFDPDPKDDPASLQATLDSLLPHDQLRRVVKEKRALHNGWREGLITFLPSYKYDVGTVGLFDSSDKRRAPSWCDRILFRSRKDKDDYEKKVEEEEQSRKRDEEMKARGMDHAGDDDEVLFDYDPDNDGETQPGGQPGLDYDEYDEADEGADEGDGAKEGSVDRIHLDVYTSHQRIMSSDHKPVTSIFTVDYDAVVPDLKAKVHAEVARELDRAENEGRPSITIVPDSHELHKETTTTSGTTDEVVDFGHIQYLRKKSMSLTLANTGRVPAVFSFVDKPTTEETSDSDPPLWLTTSFSRPESSAVSGDIVDLGKEVTLEPGETLGAVLDVLVDDISHVRLLNDGESKLEDILVLRVQEGRDHFIPVRATWTPTCIGRSIDELIRVPDGGIRAFIRKTSEKSGRIGSIPYDLEVHGSAPKELFKLTEALETLTERVLADEQMLDALSVPADKAGWPFESFTTGSRLDHIVSVIDTLDDDRPVGSAFAPEVSSMCRLETVSEVLLLFLRGLTDGIITIPLWSRIEQASLSSIGPSSSPSNVSPNEDDKAAILDILGTAPNHNICFVFLTTTLSKLISELSPITKAELDALKSPSNPRAVLGMLGRRSLSFRQNAAAPTAEALAALERRRKRERRLAEIFGHVVCRAQKPAREKDRRALEDKQRAVVELFLKRREET
ncbi:putative type ii inositol- -trisphosphate 5-phosphatase protein [Phaeoacremonium minimum UCRPA7]|uniref:Putative type ii inositol--trisphosphate 5-phosphatase protein n=1 Tax=Phaeoacremonium minimum (strain UCR-PA7) TaxID=1286976 RepID=R8BPF8_PHAM7|nr:putative type ii inositol- -trisphosphate 5-phosphatase protein [Phaeoacremonium minimum UCRPA7]EOO01227.1 putative type ii inositol- -trisphosphate 5-phosphatase protein [Phaeoacremonium minimum UCRPA7]